MHDIATGDARPDKGSVVCVCVCLCVGHIGEVCNNGLTDRDAVWDADFWGPKQSRVRWMGLRSDESKMAMMRPIVQILWPLTTTTTFIIIIIIINVIIVINFNDMTPY